MWSASRQPSSCAEPPHGAASWRRTGRTERAAALLSRPVRAWSGHGQGTVSASNPASPCSRPCPRPHYFFSPPVMVTRRGRLCSPCPPALHLPPSPQPAVRSPPPCCCHLAALGQRHYSCHGNQSGAYCSVSIRNRRAHHGRCAAGRARSRTAHPHPGAPTPHPPPLGPTPTTFSQP